MNSAIAFVTILGCLVATSLAATPNVFGVPLTCSGLCNTQCTVGDTACRAVPYLDTVCDAQLAACTGLCSTSCTCFDGCVSRCFTQGAECNPDGTLVDAALCSAVQATCLSTCPISCGFKTQTVIFNTLVSIAMPPPATLQ